MSIAPFERATPYTTPEQHARLVRLFHTLNAAGLTAFSPRMPGEAARTALNCGITLREIAASTYIDESRISSWTKYEGEAGHAMPEPIIAALFVGNLRHLVASRIAKRP